MSTLTSTPAIAEQPSTGIVGQPVRTRVVSLDIFRGFAMAVMIFVNDLSDVKGLSRWTYHIPRDIDAMSYVDLVYPFFLFAVGLSLPLAIRQRLHRDSSLPRLWFHILTRCATLIVLGLVIANAPNADPYLMPMRGSLWALLTLLGGILLLAVYPPAVPRKVTSALRGLGGLAVIVLFALFRRHLPDGSPAWLDFSYPEILGLIGLTYVAVCLLYIPTRRLFWAPLGWFVLLLLFNCACVAHWITPPVPRVPMYVFPFDNGAMSAITMGGVVISGIFLNDRLRSQPRRQVALGALFAVTCAVLGLALRPLGISKIRATPTWALWSLAAATAIFSLFYLLCDLWKRTGWAWLFRAPGANTLLTYLLPDLTYYLLAWLHLTYLLGHWNHGLPGILRSVCFTLAILLLSRAITQAKLRLQL
ncbi:MAG: DUF5009 domain-containing protein [Rhodospirillales bacterium]|nr:DUF5009 domain-containing protein [Acetobacter sp.]